tara:strand:+ start:404 stop:925 length:522 start_codon:yes stop_codon:yes gene_type:complete
MALTQIIGSGISGVTVPTFIAELDQFRLTSDTSNGASGDITANLERVDDSTFSKIGTGMTESSGVFTFPSTGLYQVICNPTTIAVVDNALKVKTMISTDSGGSFSEIASTSGGGGGSSFDQNSPSTSVYINVTNASTFRVKFQLGSVGTSSRLVGSTTSTHTNFVFMKLGASQ